MFRWLDNVEIACATSDTSWCKNREGSDAPYRLRLDRDIEEREEFAHAGNEGYLGRLPAASKRE